MNKTKDLQEELLTTWEETYKKGQLTLWIFLALREGPRYVQEIRDFIREYTRDTIQCEEQSLYRTLRKFTHLGMVRFSSGRGNKGPDRKYYELTDLGSGILQQFIDRNIRLFFNEDVRILLENNKNQ